VTQSGKAATAPGKAYPTTPDGRYFVVRGRLWRTSDPSLDPERRQHLFNELMSARRAVRHAKDDAALKAEARQRVDAAKTSLGERGPVWWTDGAPDLNRRMWRGPSMPNGIRALETGSEGGCLRRPGGRDGGSVAARRAAWRDDRRYG